MEDKRDSASASVVEGAVPIVEAILATTALPPPTCTDATATTPPSSGATSSTPTTDRSKHKGSGNTINEKPAKKALTEQMKKATIDKIEKRRKSKCRGALEKIHNRLWPLPTTVLPTPPVVASAKEKNRQISGPSTISWPPKHIITPRLPHRRPKSTQMLLGTALHLHLPLPPILRP